MHVHDKEEFEYYLLWMLVHYLLPGYLILSYILFTTVMEFFWTWVYELAFDVMLFVKHQNKNATQLYKPHIEISNLLKLRFDLL
jgi:hypothetical protein